MEYYLAVKRNDFISKWIRNDFLGKWMELENILSKVSQSQENADGMYALTDKCILAPKLRIRKIQFRLHEA
jgi:hypothetical protein